MKRKELLFKGLCNVEIPKWLLNKTRKGFIRCFTCYLYENYYSPLVPELSDLLILSESDFIQDKSLLEEIVFTEADSNNFRYHNLLLNANYSSYNKFIRSMGVVISEKEREDRLIKLILNSFTVMVNSMLDDRHHNNKLDEDWDDYYSEAGGVLYHSLRLYHLKCLDKDKLLRELYDLDICESKEMSTVLSLKKVWSSSFLSNLVDAEIRRLLSIYYKEEILEYVNYNKRR
jgi:hypothetical protein